MAQMSDDDKIQADKINGQSTQIERDEAFCARMRTAIAAGAGECADWCGDHAWN
jgi:hypothetical protein